MSRPAGPARTEAPDLAPEPAWTDPALAEGRRRLLDRPAAPRPAETVPTVAFAPGASEPDAAGVSALQRLVAERPGPVTVEVSAGAGTDVGRARRAGVDPDEHGRARAERVGQAVAAVAPPGSQVAAREQREAPGAARVEGQRAKVRILDGAPTSRAGGIPAAPRDRTPEPPPDATKAAATVAATIGATTASGAAGSLSSAAARVAAGAAMVPGRAAAVRDGESRRWTAQPRYADPAPGSDARGWQPAILRRATSDPTGRAGAAYDLDLGAVTYAYGLRGAAPVPPAHAEQLRQLAAAWDERLRDAGLPAAEARRLVHLGLARAVDRALLYTGMLPPERFVLDDDALPPPPADRRGGPRALIDRLLDPGGRR